MNVRVNLFECRTQYNRPVCPSCMDLRHRGKGTLLEELSVTLMDLKSELLSEFDCRVSAALDNIHKDVLSLFDTHTSSSLAQQPLSVKACLYHYCDLAFSDFMISPVAGLSVLSPKYWAMVHNGIEPMTIMWSSKAESKIRN